MSAKTSDSVKNFALESRYKATTSDEIGILSKRRREVLCGSEGSTREKNCQLLKLTVLVVLPGVILILQNVVNLVENVEVSAFGVLSQQYMTWHYNK